MNHRKVRKLKNEPKRFFADSKYFSWLLPEDWKSESFVGINHSIKKLENENIEFSVKRNDKVKLPASKSSDLVRKEPWLADISLDETIGVKGKFKKIPKENRRTLILNVIEDACSIYSSELAVLSKAYKNENICFINYDRTFMKAFDLDLARVIKSNPVWSRDWCKGSESYILVNPKEQFLLFPYSVDPYLEMSVIVTEKKSAQFLNKNKEKFFRVYAHCSVKNNLDKLTLNNIDYFSSMKELERLLAITKALDAVNKDSDDLVILKGEGNEPFLKKGYDLSIKVAKHEGFLDEYFSFNDFLTDILKGDCFITIKWSLLSKYERLAVQGKYKCLIERAVKEGAKVDVSFE